jgi:hypothetical protein
MGSVTLSAPRPLSGNSDFPGVLAVGIAPFDSLDKVVTTVTGVAVIPSGALSVARLELKNTTTNYIENGISGGDNRSVGITGNIPCIFNVANGEDLDTAAMIKELMKGLFVFYLEMKDGTIRACGSQCGAEAITVDDQTGGQGGDLNGFTATIQTLEGEFSRSYLLDAAGLVDYAAAIIV